MDREITRRAFLKLSVTGTAVFSIGGLGIGLGDSFTLEQTVRCKGCGAINVFIRPYSSYLAALIEPQYCCNCGVNTSSLKFDIDCKDLHCRSLEKITGKTRRRVPACCQLPFPNHGHLKKSKKPSFSLGDIKF